MATTKRQKRSSAGVPTTRIAAEPTPPAGELHEQVVLLAAGTTPDQPSINEAPTLTLTGTVCADFICGGLSGQIAKPATITLSPELSTFTLERVDGDAFPEPPKIDCNGTLAKPLGG